MMGKDSRTFDVCQNERIGHMKHAHRILALMLVCMTMASCAHAATDLVSVTAEEYALLEKYKRLEEIIKMVDRSYLWEYEEDKLLDGAAQGILGALGDDYSYYITPIQMENEMESINGEYGGLGIEVFGNPNDLTITIRRVFFNSPAQQAGIRPSDKIIRVNDEDVTAYDLSKAVSIMRGEVGGEVTLTILRDTETFEVTVKRAIVQTEILSYEVLADNFGYVRIHYFEGNAVNQFNEAVEMFKREGVKGLIIDLRDNPGGLVTLAVDIADVFLGEVVVVSSKDKYGREMTTYANEGAWDIPVALLINGSTASSSEILAAALMDHGVAKAVGVTSYGKGIMQTMSSFHQDGAGIQLTTDYWYTPNGVCVHEVGIEPDIIEELSEDAIDDNFQFVREKDNQLQKAVEALKEMMAE